MSNEPELTAPTDRASNTRWLIFGLACFTSFLNYAHRYSWGVVKPYLQEETGLTDVDVGWLDGVFSATYALGQFPGGLAGDVYGPRLVIPFVAVLWSAVVAGPAMVTSFWRLVVVRLLFGATQAAAYPNLGKITRSWFPLSIRTSVQGAVASFSGRAGGASSSLIIATLLMGGIGLTWQLSLWVLALVGIVFAIVFVMLFRNHPHEHPWTNQAEQRLIEEDEKPVSKDAKAKFQWTGTNCRNLAMFFGATFCAAFADNLFVYWMPTFLREAKGFGDAEMGIFSSLPLWGGAFGGLCGGFLNDILIRRIGNRKVSRRLVASGGMIVAAILICSSLILESGRMIMVVLFFCKFFSDWSQPTWWGTVTDIGGRAAGRVFGMVNLVGGAGAFAAGPIMGYVKKTYGWEELFVGVGCVYILTAIFWANIDCTKKLVTDETDEEDSSDI